MSASISIVHGGVVMTDEPFAVRPEELRAVAGLLDDEARRLTSGLAGFPGLVVAAPEWRAGVALAGLEAAGHAWFRRLGDRVAATSGDVRAAADAYETVDDRAAGRFASLPR
ncbi:type VII secretion target [Micromonospora sp. NPDC047644]|uniref:type VII secretion target n=1 Tax=Micromonospora sp. NPDC047644 TaxID=3157203 RepID=UPI0034542C7D